MKPVLLVDRDLPALRPLTRFSSTFKLRTGIYSIFERLQLKNKKQTFVYYHPDSEYEKQICACESYTSFRQFSTQTIEEAIENSQSKYKIIIDAGAIKPFELLVNIGTTIESDLKQWLQNNKTIQSKRSTTHFQLIGKHKNLHIHKKAIVNLGCVFNTKNGPIILDNGVQVSAFSYLEGPLYVGKNTQLDNVRITGGCSVGTMTRLGGEIENSIIADFTNKHHEGFLGHSIVGKWVNIGALATTSDLKNNYGMVRLQIPQERLPKTQIDIQDVNTNCIKFGSIIGDCVKIAIGTMINTGTVIDASCNVFGGSPPKYMQPLSWGVQGQAYDKDRFLQDSKIIFARRKEVVPSAMPSQILQLHASRIATTS